MVSTTFSVQATSSPWPFILGRKGPGDEAGAEGFKLLVLMIVVDDRRNECLL